jgi:hypothetical protein
VSASGPRRLPLPPPPSAGRMLIGLASGVVGTGWLFDAATGSAGGLSLAFGAALFGLGLWLAGRPFVLATAWRHEARRRARASAAITKLPPRDAAPLPTGAEEAAGGPGGASGR